MNTYKRLTPCIFIHDGKAVKWFDNRDVLSDDVVELAKKYCESDAKELIVFDLSETDEQHDMAIDFMKKINREIHIPMLAGGNNHHMAEALFKAFGKALDMATMEEPRMKDVWSTKGSL